ncbi:resuscitation-promoting factor [Schaalia vaccimaxillae]|uniref:resuscitation-promoting factor n=1 Tax=Schaalia vaccimaxillae TaxID=183916 RepID=UPI0003B45578|nr:resuscitation-promoting factor [Schaalia vaccimaxillae]
MISHPSRRTVIATASVLALLVTGTAGASMAASHRDVTIEVDGVAAPVSGFFADVEGALRAGGVQVSEHDLVAPQATAALSDGETVVVRTANQYMLKVDGEPITAWSTAQSIDGVLDSVEADGSIVMAADRSVTRDTLPASSQASTLAVEADGKSIEVEMTPSDTADSLLAKAQIATSPLDRVEFVSENGAMLLRVQRVTRGHVTETEAVAFTTEERSDDTIYEGETQVLQEGADGSVTTTRYRETVGSTVLVDVVVSQDKKEPTNKVVAVGTKKRPVAAASTSSSTSSSASSSSSAASGSSAVSGDVWAALAQCESGGNPATNTGNGYYGMYQFSLSTWQAMGGSGLPSNASAAEQTARAQALQARAGWGQWPGCASRLGLL